MINCYLLTCADENNTGVLISALLDPKHPRFKGPMACCTNAAGRKFWRAYLKQYDVDRVTHIRPIAGHVPATEIP